MILLNAKTPFYGTAGVFDVLAQATGKFLDREQAQEALEIERRLAIGELAAKQSAEANKDMFLKEAELRTKLLGYNQELAKTYLNFGEETRNKMLQFDLDVEKTKFKHLMKMLKIYKNQSLWSTQLMVKTIFQPQCNLDLMRHDRNCTILITKSGTRGWHNKIRI
ncbi:MAG: hypothetical protein CM15mV91_350 [uncultured marine virus]|nr:MAG: hypothetical protein CM15mV91_350 [uncultured marine virus]